MKRIAIIGRGAHTLPTYRAMLNKFAEHYTLVLYSEVAMKPEWLSTPHSYTIRSVSSDNYPRRIRDFILLLMIIRDHWRNPYALVHAHSTYPSGMIGIVLKKLFRIPILVCLDGAEGSALPSIHFGDLLSKRRARLNQWVINRADAVTALTHFQCGEVYRNLNIQKNISVIPRGVEMPAYSLLAQEKASIPVTILSIGYLSPVKDPITLIRTFYEIQKETDCRLIHIGEDYMNGEVQKLVEKLGIEDKVSFKGHLPYDQVKKFFERAHLFLLTSVYESQAMVVVEAMAMGVPVCGTHVGIMADLSGTCCITVPPGESSALAQEVIALLKNKEKMETLRKNGYAWAYENDLNKCVNTTLKIYKSLIKD
jgi:glycosyltransferase involved in cell wall biosynthesis